MSWKGGKMKNAEKLKKNTEKNENRPTEKKEVVLEYAHLWMLEKCSKQLTDL